ncbi:MAG TPA: ATP-binding protein, partial [Chromatiales bacterium]|nr:ATP-binding protein [Chromatiales bacterium]
MTTVNPLRPEQLYTPVDPDQLDFRTTAELDELEGALGQERALDALQFGVAIRQEGYNLFVLGPPGVGKHSLVDRYLQRRAQEETTPNDWIYVANFLQPNQPRAIELPPGDGNRFRTAMQHLIIDLTNAIPAAYETEQYQRRHQALLNAMQEKSRRAFEALSEEAARHNLIILHGEKEITFVPARDGKPLTQEEYEALDPRIRQEQEAVVRQLEEKLREFFRQRQQWQKQLRHDIETLNNEVGMFAVGHLVEELRDKFAHVPEVAEYLSEVQDNVIKNLAEFFAIAVEAGGNISPDAPPFRPYQVNVLVDNSKRTGAPVYYEDYPLYHNLLGRIEYQPQMGVLVTDYTMIKPGALHRANGGYLVLDALKVLQQPFAWESLKRALSAKHVRIQSLGEMYSLLSTVTLDPEVIPLDIKVILVGDRKLYYQLLALDSDFGKLFKVVSDFADELERSVPAQREYARFLTTISRRFALLPLQREAVARVLEHSSRLADDTRKLSLHMQTITDLVREADYWARQGGVESIDRVHVQQALEAQIYRNNRLYQRQLEEFRRGTLFLDVEGTVVAQVNGLFIIELGGFSFGQPARITATARLGDGEVVDIEREVELGGAIHSKGVYILSAYLAAHYARKCPLSLTATLVFEQSYSHVEGDSASVGELCALLSALAEGPINQALAVTGSVNQRGQVQPIGGVNEKIEGFFDVCREKGLTGEQGVLIPASNVANLMLRHDVVEAVAAGRFRIYPVA